MKNNPLTSTYRVDLTKGYGHVPESSREPDCILYRFHQLDSVKDPFLPMGDFQSSSKSSIVTFISGLLCHTNASVKPSNNISSSAPVNQQRSDFLHKLQLFEGRYFILFPKFHKPTILSQLSLILTHFRSKESFTVVRVEYCVSCYYVLIPSLFLN